MERLEAEGLQVQIGGGHAAPDGFEHLALWNIDVPEDLQDAVERHDSERTLAAGALRQLDAFTPEMRGQVIDYVTAELDYVVAHGVKVGACNIVPDEHTGVRLTFFGVPAPEPEVPESEIVNDENGVGAVPETPTSGSRYGDVEVPKVELQANINSHALQERYTDLATRGLIRSLADDPNAALILLVARLFASVALVGSGDTNQSVSTVRAQPYRRVGHAPIAALDGDVFARLDERRTAYLESGLRPIPWVASLSHGERMTFLAELMAITLDAKEISTHLPRHGARSEALEVVELTGHDIKVHWLPDTDFYLAHSKAQLLGMLDAMEAEPGPAASYKKADLAAHVAATAGDKSWAPDALSWKAAPAVVDEEPAEGDGDAGDEAAAASHNDNDDVDASAALDGPGENVTDAGDDLAAAA